jgi:hypothetical protein
MLLPDGIWPPLARRLGLDKRQDNHKDKEER